MKLRDTASLGGSQPFVECGGIARAHESTELERDALVTIRWRSPRLPPQVPRDLHQPCESRLAKSRMDGPSRLVTWDPMYTSDARSVPGEQNQAAVDADTCYGGMRTMLM